jgi:hypothetical protein
MMLQVTYLALKCSAIGVWQAATLNLVMLETREVAVKSLMISLRYSIREPVLALLWHRESVKLDGLDWSVQRRRIDRGKRAVARPVVVAAQTAVMETKRPVPVVVRKIVRGVEMLKGVVSHRDSGVNQGCCLFGRVVEPISLSYSSPED